jgi:hypothetical protein
MAFRLRDEVDEFLNKFDTRWQSEACGDTAILDFYDKTVPCPCAS